LKLYLNSINSIRPALPIAIIGGLLLLVFELIRRSKGGKNDLFNFEKDVSESTKNQGKQVKLDMEKTALGISPNKRNIFVPNNAKHIFVCGTTGSGKTVALSNFVKAGIEYDYPMLIVDGKGDIGKDSLLDIVTRLSNEKKVYVIDLNNPDTCDKYNPFRNTSADIIKDMLINMTNWSEEHYKYNTERYIQRLCGLLELASIAVSLDSLTKFLPPAQFTLLSKKLAEETLLTKEEHARNMELAKVSGEIAEGASARFSTIKESRLGQIFHEDGIDIYSALQENAVVLFVLNPLMYPEMSPLIGKLIVIDSKKAVSLLYQNTKKRIFYILDEINVYISRAMIDLVNKSRSANITCILATQSLSDLDNINGETFLETVVENCNNYILLRQNSNTNAESWAQILGTRKTMSATYQIKGGSDGSATPTELGSLHRAYEYIYHPNTIKELETGHAIFLSRDLKFHSKVKINKPF